MIIGVPAQEKGIRPARTLPYRLDVRATVKPSAGTVVLKFLNTGWATAVFHVRSGNPADSPRSYTVEPGKWLEGSWSVTSSYDLSVYGPNGFVRYFQGSIGSGAAVLDVVSKYDREDDHDDDRDDDRGSIKLIITNTGAKAEVSVLDAYTGHSRTRLHHRGETWEDRSSLEQFYGWYDLIVTVENTTLLSNTGWQVTSKPGGTASQIRLSGALLP